MILGHLSARFFEFGNGAWTRGQFQGARQGLTQWTGEASSALLPVKESLSTLVASVVGQALPAGLKALTLNRIPGFFYAAKIVCPDGVTRWISNSTISSASVGVIEGRIPRGGWGQLQRASTDNRNGVELAQASQFTVLDYDGLWSGLIADYADVLRGSAVEVYLGHDLLPLSGWSLRFSGVITKWSSGRAFQWTFRVSPNDDPWRGSVPRHLINSGDRPNGDQSQWAQPIPIVYGLQESQDTGNKGAIPLPLVDSPASLYLVSLIKCSRTLQFWQAETELGYPFVTEVVGGKLQHIVDAVGGTGAGSADVIGIRIGPVVGERGAAWEAGAWERNPAAQGYDLVNQFIFGDRVSNTLLQDTRAPLSLWKAAIEYTLRRHSPMGLQSARWIGQQAVAQNLLGELCLSWELRVYVTAGGLYGCKVVDFSETDIYKRDPLLTELDVRELSFDDDDSYLLSSVSVKTGFNQKAGKFTEQIVVEEPRFQVAYGYRAEQFDQAWNIAAGPGDGIAFGRDPASRRLWLYGRARRTASFRAGLLVLDTELLSRFWLDHYWGPKTGGFGWSGAPWAAHELLMLAVSEDPNTMTVQVKALDMTFLRNMTWDNLWSRRNPGFIADGVPRMYFGRRCFVRDSKKWIRTPLGRIDPTDSSEPYGPNAEIVEVAASDLVNTTNTDIVEPIEKLGTLIECQRPNRIERSSFVTEVGLPGADTFEWDTKDRIFKTSITPRSARLVSWLGTLNNYTEFAVLAAASAPDKAFLSAISRFDQPVVISSWEDLLAGALGRVPSMAICADSALSDHERPVPWWTNLRAPTVNTHFTQNTVALQPKLIKNQQNGRSCVRFDGVDDYMHASFQSVDASLSTLFGTAFAVFKPNTVSNHATIYRNDAVWCDNQDSVGLFLKQNGGGYDMHAFNWDAGGGGDFASKAGLTLGEMRIATWVHTGYGPVGKLRLVLDHNYKPTQHGAADSDATFDVTGTMRIGADSLLTNFFDGDLYALLFFPATAVADRMRIHHIFSVIDFLAMYYGLTRPVWEQPTAKGAYKRNSDSKWWNVAGQSWDVSLVKNTLPPLEDVSVYTYPRTHGFIVGKAGDGPGAGAGAARIYNEDVEGMHEMQLYHAQLEPCEAGEPVSPTSPIVTDGAVVTRAADCLSISNFAPRRSVETDRLSLSLEATPWWNSTDLPAGAEPTFWHLPYDRDNETRLFYSADLGALVYRVRAKGINYDAKLVMTLSRFTRYSFGARLVGAEGDYGIAPYTASVFASLSPGGAFVRGIDAVALAPPTKRDISRQYIGYQSAPIIFPNEIQHLSGWWKADFGAYRDGGNNLCTWLERCAMLEDASGKGNHWFQPSTVSRPYLQRFPPLETNLAADLSGGVDLPYLQFTYASGEQWMEMTGRLTADLFTPAAGAIFAAIMVRTFQNVSTADVVGNGAQAGLLLAANQSGGNWLFEGRNDDGAIDVVAPVERPPLISPTVGGCWHTGGTLFATSGDARSPASAASGNTVFPANMPLLMRRAAGAAIQANFFEAMTFKGDITQAEAEGLCAYMWHKWAGSIFWWNGMKYYYAYQRNVCNAALRFLEVSQRPWSDRRHEAQYKLALGVL